MIRVQKEDFDAYHALDMDSKAVAAAQQNRKKRLFNDHFSQEIPEYVSQSDYRSGPPILPPHLNQVILNKVSWSQKHMPIVWLHFLWEFIQRGKILFRYKSQ